MIINCEAALVLTNCRDKLRFSRAVVGVGADKSGNPILVVNTSVIKEKFKIVDNCVLRSTVNLTISFKTPKKDLYIRECDHILLKALIGRLKKIMNRELIPKLADISTIEKMKPKPISLTLKDNAFSSVDLSNKCLQKLSIDNFRLIPRLVWKLNNLVDLRLIKCGLTQIPEELYPLGKTLRTLDLSQNQIESIDRKFVFSMKRLTYLELKSNKLVYISHEIDSISSLERLGLSHNQLRHLPNNLGQISSLKSIDLSHNLLNSFPFILTKNFRFKTHLEFMDISGNPLREYKESSMPSKEPLPTLFDLSCAAVVSAELVPYCRQHLPKFIYQKMVGLRRDNCALCSNIIVVGIHSQYSVVYENFRQLANTLSMTPFPFQPNVPIVRHLCYYCRSSYDFRIE